MALSSEENRSELLVGDLRKTLFLLALPILAEQFLSFCVGFVDTFLSGRLPGSISRDATSAVGVAAYIGWLASLLFGLVGAGTTALVSRAWGGGDRAEANRIANRSIALSALLGVVVFALIYLSAPAFAGFLGMDGERFRIAVRYLQFDAFGHIFLSVSLVGAAALRGTGDMRSPMLILGLVSLVNLVVSPLLVFGVGPFDGMGIDGIVAGTVIARSSGGLLMIAALSRGLSGLKLSRAELILRGDIVRRILRIGAPAALDGVLVWASHFLFLRIINQISDVAFAAHIIGIQIEAITYLPAVAWGFASATMVGQSLGARDRARALRAGHEAMLQCGLLAILISCLFFAGADVIYTLMHNDPLVRETGIPAFRLLALFQVPLAVSIVYVYALRGAGDTRWPLFINSFGVMCVRLPIAYVCGILLEGGLIGAWIGMYADEVVRALLVAVRYSRGRWLETKV